MGRVDEYREELRGLAVQAWERFLLAESRLPGPRGNIELAQAVAAEGDEGLFRRFIALDAEVAPVGTADEFLPFCGILGMGRLAAEGDDSAFAILRRFASDVRWRCREAVAMALQAVGRADFDRMVDAIGEWAGGGPCEQRAAVAALCEPDLLDDAAHARTALRFLDAVTASLTGRNDRRSDDFRVLRRGLGYCWSVAVVALPEEGKPLFEKWARSDDPDVAWMIRENLSKRRLVRMDAEWVEELLRTAVDS